VAHTTPLIAAAVALAVIKPLTIPVGLILLAHAWAIPELYAARGARSIRPDAGQGSEAEQRAVGLLGDLVDHRGREVLRRSGLVVERQRLGVWLLGESGALLIRPGGHRVDCYCVRVPDPALPPSDRIAHLLLALREDEAGFVTVANLVFSGAPWRVRRRLRPPGRDGLAEAVRQARTS